MASGYADGSIRIWDFDKGTCETTLNGHKGAVTALRYNKLGSLLASGGKDNDIILWDVVGETGLFRLRGHRDQVCFRALSNRQEFEILAGSYNGKSVFFFLGMHCRLRILFSWNLVKSLFPPPKTNS